MVTIANDCLIIKMKINIIYIYISLKPRAFCRKIKTSKYNTHKIIIRVNTL